MFVRAAAVRFPYGKASKRWSVGIRSTFSACKLVVYVCFLHRHAECVSVRVKFGGANIRGDGVRRRASHGRYNSNKPNYNYNIQEPFSRAPSEFGAASTPTTSGWEFHTSCACIWRPNTNNAN